MTNKQFASKMRRLPDRLSEHQVEADRLTRELEATKRLLATRRKAHMLLTADQRREQAGQFNLTVEAIDAHIETLDLELKKLPLR